MKKLVTALLIVLPLILLIALFAVTGITQISADIAATGIVINNKGEDGIFYLDIANYQNPLCESDLGVEVQPLAASKRGYSLKITEPDGATPTNVISLREDGAFILNDVGTAKLTYVSDDGGYSDSVLVGIVASAPMDYTPVIKDDLGIEQVLFAGTDTDYALTIDSGNYTASALLYPASLQNAEVAFECSNDNIIYLNGENGNFNARFGGNCILTYGVKCASGNVKKTVAVTVNPASDNTLNGTPLEGGNAVVTSSTNVTQVNFTLQTSAPVTKENISISGANVSSVQVTEVPEIDGAYYITLNLTTAYETATLAHYTLSVGGENYNFAINFAPRAFLIFAPTNKTGIGDILTANGGETRLSVYTPTLNEDIRYTWFITGKNFIVTQSGKSGCSVKSLATGKSQLILEWELYDNLGTLVTRGTETRNITCVNAYSALLFAENADSHGLGNLAIAKYAFIGDEIKPYTYLPRFKARDLKGNAGVIDDDVKFVTSSNCATLTRDYLGIRLQVQDDGDVTVSAIWKYGEAFGIAPATFTFRAVDGIYVSTDAQIRKAFSLNKAVVLEKDIYLGENLFNVKGNARTPKYDDATMRQKLMAYTSEIGTTADWKYFENFGLPRPTLRYCLDIAADVHGNGHKISAEYIVNTLDGTDKPYDFSVFKGPLDFVATSMDGTALAAVKGQDNIAFLARTDGVRLDNVILTSCDDQTLYADGGLNLSVLKSMGTTLELMADVDITNSRIKNGRTVVRAFGRYGVDEGSPIDAQTEKIHVNMENCILQNAREFLLKLGTNRFVRGTESNSSPYLECNGTTYTTHNSSACDEYLNDDAFMQNLVLTDVTLKDSVLRTSGLFSIGFETHFAGKMLTGTKVTRVTFAGWRDLAATSYPAALHLVGDVLLDDWKQLDSVDSSTLIESGGTGIPLLSFNIAEMLNILRHEEGFANIICNEEGVDYVHGGIVFYGGGKNYSFIDLSSCTSPALTDFNVNLSVLESSDNATLSFQGRILPLAAGTEDFRFLMLTKTS